MHANVSGLGHGPSDCMKNLRAYEYIPFFICVKKTFAEPLRTRYETRLAEPRVIRPYAHQGVHGLCENEG